MSVIRFHNSYLSLFSLWGSSISNVAGLWTVELLIDFQYKQRLSHASGLSSPGSAAHPSKGEAVQCRSGLVSDKIYPTLVNVLNKRSNATTQLYFSGKILKHENKPRFIYSADERRTCLYLQHPVVFLRLWETRQKGLASISISSAWRTNSLRFSYLFIIFLPPSPPWIYYKLGGIFVINLSLLFCSLQGVLDGVVVRNIATFVIDNIKANILLLKLDFGLSVPEIVAEGEHYAIDGNLGGLLPIYGEGRFE